MDKNAAAWIEKKENKQEKKKCSGFFGTWNTIYTTITRKSNSERASERDGYKKWYFTAHLSHNSTSTCAISVKDEIEQVADNEIQ